LTEFGRNEINRVFGQAYDLQFELDRAEMSSRVPGPTRIEKDGPG
jgi:hypothetical protein